MAIDFDDTEYTIPGELFATAYDLRTGPERLHAQADDHQRRIAALEQRLRHVELALHRVMNANETADSM